MVKRWHPGLHSRYDCISWHLYPTVCLLNSRFTIFKLQYICDCDMFSGAKFELFDWTSGWSGRKQQLMLVPRLSQPKMATRKKGAGESEVDQRDINNHIHWVPIGLYKYWCKHHIPTKLKGPLLFPFCNSNLPIVKYLTTASLISVHHYKVNVAVLLVASVYLFENFLVLYQDFLCSCERVFYLLH